MDTAASPCFRCGLGDRSDGSFAPGRVVVPWAWWDGDAVGDGLVAKRPAVDAGGGLDLAQRVALLDELA